MSRPWSRCSTCPRRCQKASPDSSSVSSRSWYRDLSAGLWLVRTPYSEAARLAGCPWIFGRLWTSGLKIACRFGAPCFGTDLWCTRWAPLLWCGSEETHARSRIYWCRSRRYTWCGSSCWRYGNQMGRADQACPRRESHRCRAGILGRGSGTSAAECESIWPARWSRARRGNYFISSSFRVRAELFWIAAARSNSEKIWPETRRNRCTSWSSPHLFSGVYLSYAPSSIFFLSNNYYISPLIDLSSSSLLN